MEITSDNFNHLIFSKNICFFQFFFYDLLIYDGVNFFKSLFLDVLFSTSYCAKNYKHLIGVFIFHLPLQNILYLYDYQILIC